VGIAGSASADAGPDVAGAGWAATLRAPRRGRPAVVPAGLARDDALRGVAAFRAVDSPAAPVVRAAEVRAEDLVADRAAVGRFAVVAFAVARLAVDLFAVDLLAVDFFAAVDFAVARFAVDFLAVDFFAVDLFAVDRVAPPPSRPDSSATLRTSRSRRDRVLSTDASRCASRPRGRAPTNSLIASRTPRDAPPDDERPRPVREPEDAAALLRAAM
jgi:hypothetical protein